jgi:hypothetical protein
MDNGDNEGGVSESDGGMLYTIPESSQHGRVASNWCRGQAAHIQLAGMEGFFSTTCLVVRSRGSASSRIEGLAGKLWELRVSLDRGSREGAARRCLQRGRCCARAQNRGALGPLQAPFLDPPREPCPRPTP